jgi:spermidine synthase
VAIVAMLPWLLAKRGVTMRRTRFGTTLVFDSMDADGTPVRLLNVNGTFQSVCYTRPDLRFELACVYHRNMAEVIGACGARRVLVVGGGGYSLPKYLATHGNASVDVVEVDPKVTALAREFFFLEEAEEAGGSRLRLANGDGWDYLRAAEGPFDVVVNDAFSGNRPLGPLKTDEGARVVREHLAAGGVYLANVRCALEGRKSRTLKEVCGAFGRVFVHVAYVPEWPDKPTELGNNAFVASDRELSLPEGAIIVK